MEEPPGPNACAVAVIALTALLATPARGSSLAEQLLRASTTGNLANAVVTRLVRTAVRGADFPATATTPSFTYEFNPELGTFERSSLSLGPQFAERSETIGKAHFDIGLVYLSADFKTLDGRGLEGSRLGPETVEIPRSRAIITQEATFSKFTLVSHVATLNVTYGLMDRWDVNLLLPAVSTSLDTTGQSSTQIAGNVGAVSTQFQVADSAFGVGDILLRTKYHLANAPFANMALGLTVRLPTGRKDDSRSPGGDNSSCEHSLDSAFVGLVCRSGRTRDIIGTAALGSYRQGVAGNLGLHRNSARASDAIS